MSHSRCIKSVTLSPRKYITLMVMAACFGGLSPAAGQVTEDPAITAMMDRWKLSNLNRQEVRGWRIQIIATVDRRQAETMRRRFENQYPEYPVQFVHNDPYYHLKAGAFTTMQKAQAFMWKIQKDYPQAIPVTEMLKVEEFLLY